MQRNNRMVGVFKNANMSFILIGILIAFALFFVRPVFLNSEAQMKFFTYVPAWEYVGIDLEYVRTYVSAWFNDRQTPYIGLNLYPPLTILLFSPILLTDPSTGYTILIVLTLIAYGIVTWVIPRLILGDEADPSITLLFFLTGLVSYGFHFELERGQFNLIAFAFTMLAVYLYHKKPQYRFLAYIFLTISVQLKVYPSIFILMLIDDWQNWKKILWKVGLFAFANVSLLFALGYPIFQDFIAAISMQMVNPESTVINHSIKSFSDILFRKIGYGDIFLVWGMKMTHLKQLISYSWLIQIVLFVYLSICLILVIVREITFKNSGISSHLFFACTLVALLIPSVSLDYKLPLLVGPASLFMNIRYSPNEPPPSLMKLLIVSLFGSFVYAITLFSYEYKPALLINNMPILFILLTLVTVDAWQRGSNFDSEKIL